ncbi:MAG: RNB domain-containing ribonuclease, partial [Campylobacterales bacterium]|nr:RNB domain-containing ribonuclease [Campylobacterales bacterium]
MVKDLFYKLSYGCNKSALSNKELKIITDLESLGLLHLHKDVLKVSKENILGVIDLPKNSNSKNQKNSVAYLTPIAGRNDKDPIINGRDLHGAKDGDIVIGKIIGSQRGRKKAKVVYVAHVGKPDLIGVAIHDGKKILIKEFFTKNTIHTTSRQKALKTLPRNSVLSVDGNTHEIKEILGVLDDPFVDEKIVLKRYERHEEFSDRVINESVAFGEEVYKDLYPNRKDLTHLPFVTIDPVTAKDYDDAVYYDKDKNVLYVAIADVT